MATVYSNGAIFVATTPTNGIATVNLNGTPNDPTDDFITYIPNPGYHGNDSFTYTIEDADGQTATATVFILVNPNDPGINTPLALNDSETTPEDVAVIINVLVNDNFGLDGQLQQVRSLLLHNLYMVRLL
ncbi:Ig-like domain-containing protein [Flavobacterium sp. 3HN19-14]|uniref:Ig-like domain-containing protein n=1 Tax=Flavobacterium sp. 3HN19-14 TaxID=3448133 RepID=UPI003EE3FCA1